MTDPKALLRAYGRYGFPTKQRVLPTPEPELEQPEPEEVDGLLELAKAVLALAQREMPAPVVNMEVRVPEQQVPVVNVTVDVPEQPAPLVRVSVPQQPAPQVTVQPTAVNVTNQVPTLQDIRIVSMPPIDAEVERDVRGRIVKVREG